MPTELKQSAAKQIESKSLILSLVIAVFFHIFEQVIGHSLPKSELSRLLFIGAIRIIEIRLFISIAGASSLGLEKHDLLPGFVKGLIWSLAFGAAVLIIAEILWLRGLDPIRMLRSKMPQQSIELFVFYCVGGIIAPIAEEIFFRGIIYGFFRRWGIAPALILSTLAFFMAHPKGSIPQLAGGILFALAYEAEKKLMTPIVIHSLGNMAIFTVPLIQKCL